MAKRRGVGHQIPAGSQAVWVSTQGVLDTPLINLSATTFEERYGHIQSGYGYTQGFYGENFGINETALLNWYAAQPAAHKEQWDGIPTGGWGQTNGPADEWEQWDLAFTENQLSSGFYHAWWWFYEPGGTQETAVVVNEGNWREHGPKWPRGVTPGLHSKPGPVGGWSYPKWYDVQWVPPNQVFLSLPRVGDPGVFWLRDANGFVPGKVKAVSEADESVTFVPDAGGRGVKFSLDDDGRLWWLNLAAPTPAPVPAPSPPPPTPAPPTPTLKPPEPKPEPIPLPGVPEPFPDDAMRTFDLAPKWEELAGKRGKIARLSRLAREAQRIQKALLEAKVK